MVSKSVGRNRCVAKKELTRIGTSLSITLWVVSPLIRSGEFDLVRIIVIVALLLIVFSLGTALYYLYHDRGQGTRMVRALAIRVALSASLIAFLLISYHFGWIGEKGLR